MSLCMAPSTDNGAQPALRLRILLIDDELAIRKTLTHFLEHQGHEVIAVSNAADAHTQAMMQAFDLALVDVHFDAAAGLEMIHALRSTSPWIKILVMTATASIDTAVRSMKAGSIDYLPKPVSLSHLACLLREISIARRLEMGVNSLQDAIGHNHPELAVAATANPAMQRVIYLARQVAQTDATLLIRGESGTGKGVLVKAIHHWSARAGKPLVTVSCPSLSAELLESELFGHVKGAFTSALRDNAGRVSLADGGTLFLDEIGDLPITIQPKLLRFVQAHEYERIGEQLTREADVRIVAATNVNLEAAVASGRFRQDLLYRLNVIQIEIPPLRERPEDIVPTAERMLAHFTRQRERKILGFTTAAADLLRRHSWPGNVRELRNVIERCAILARADYIDADLLPESDAQASARPTIGSRLSLEALEELHIRRVLAATHSLEEACQVLGINAATLWRRRKRYRI